MTDSPDEPYDFGFGSDPPSQQQEAARQQEAAKSAVLRDVLARTMQHRRTTDETQSIIIAALMTEAGLDRVSITDDLIMSLRDTQLVIEPILGGFTVSLVKPWRPPPFDPSDPPWRRAIPPPHGYRSGAGDAEDAEDLPF